MGEGPRRHIEYTVMATVTTATRAKLSASARARRAREGEADGLGQDYRAAPAIIMNATGVVVAVADPVSRVRLAPGSAAVVERNQVQRREDFEGRVVNEPTPWHRAVVTSIRKSARASRTPSREAPAAQPRARATGPRGPLSDAHRAKISRAASGRAPWNKGRTLSAEHRERIREARLASEQRRRAEAA